MFFLKKLKKKILLKKELKNFWANFLIFLNNVDNTMTLYIMAGQTEQKHKQMVLDQYGR